MSQFNIGFLPVPRLYTAVQGPEALLSVSSLNLG